MSEIFDVLDGSGRIIGTATREECHRNPALVHRVVHVLVLDSRGGLYLQRRAADKDVQPDKWDTSVGGHVGHGEEVEPAAYRELREELGIEGVVLQGPLYAYIARSHIETEAVTTYRLVYNGPIHPDQAEISEGRFWSFDEIAAALGTGIFTPNFEQEIALYRAWRTAAHPVP